MGKRLLNRPVKRLFAPAGVDIWAGNFLPKLARQILAKIIRNYE